MNLKRLSGPFDTARKSMRTVTLQAFLTRLIWLCVLPLVLLAIYLAVTYVHTLQTQRDRDASDRARNLATALDRNLGARIAALQALAASSLMDDPPRLKAFYKEAQAFRESFSSHVILADPSMQMLLNTRVPFGTVLPKLPQSSGYAAAPAVLATGKPAVGDIVFGPVAKEPLIAVAAPVIRNGQTRALLLSIIETHQFQQRLDDLALPAGWSVTMFDGKDEVIARRAPKDRESGPAAAQSPGRFIAKLAVSRWTVVLEIPRGVYLAPLVAAIAALAAAILAVTLVSVLGGGLASRRLARSVATLTEKQPPEAPLPAIAEIETVRTMLADAAVAREASEEALYESESRFRATFEQAAVGIAHVASDGRWLKVNQKLCDIVGYSREELLTKTFQDITHPDDLDVDLGYMRQMLGGEIKTYSTEKRYFHKDGSLIWINLTVSIVRDDLGRPKYFISVVEDITERKRAEEKLQRSRFALIEAQKLAKIGNWEWDVRAGLHTWSKEIYNIYGRDPELPPADIQEVPKYFTPKSWARLNADVEKGLTNGVPYECDAEVVRPDGAHRWITARGEAVRDAQGAVVVLRGTVQDITERKKAEEVIKKLNDELEQRVRDRTAQLEAANKELEAFSYSVSHDLRAPLRHLAGFVELLNKRATMLDDKSRHYLEVIGGAASQMGRLVDDLLSFSRMGRSEMMRSRVDLRILLDEAINDLRTDIKGRNIQWDIKALPVVSGDPAMLKLVFVNLLSNAVKFTKSREQAVIEVGCDRTDGGVTIVYVRDNGVGFDMKYVDKLFNLFQRLHRPEEFEGTGLGLANVRRIIHRHGGKTWAKGEPGQGTTVFFSLPDIKGG